MHFYLCVCVCECVLTYSTGLVGERSICLLCRQHYFHPDAERRKSHSETTVGVQCHIGTSVSHCVGWRLKKWQHFSTASGVIVHVQQDSCLRVSALHLCSTDARHPLWGEKLEQCFLSQIALFSESLCENWGGGDILISAVVVTLKNQPALGGVWAADRRIITTPAAPPLTSSLHIMQHRNW